ncbi:MAG: cyclic-di-AMP receptor [Oscillospiraceae bacterium]|jgi:uncharacterized protein YaaQ|nr:cyclic-di-AMP receptor [Oscillospiraceae bacterium]
MKLIFAIVNNDDSNFVQSALTQEGFSATKLSTTGGFLKSGNTTFIIGVDDDKVDDIISIIAKHSKKRQHIVPTAATYGTGMYSSIPIEVTVGGATVFVTDVTRFEKL